MFGHYTCLLYHMMLGWRSLQKWKILFTNHLHLSFSVCMTSAFYKCVTQVRYTCICNSAEFLWSRFVGYSSVRRRSSQARIQESRFMCWLCGFFFVLQVKGQLYCTYNCTVHIMLSFVYDLSPVMDSTYWFFSSNIWKNIPISL